MHQHTEDRLRRLLAVGRAVARHDELELVLGELLREAMALTGALYASIEVADAESVGLDRPVARGVEPGAHEHTLGVPISRRGVVVGSLHLAGKEAGAFDDDDGEVAAVLADWAAIALRDSRATRELDGRSAGARRSLAAIEAERRRWAQELHDETLQGLAGLQVLLASAVRRADPPRLGAVVRQAVELLSTEIASLRTLITELCPAALDELGLAPALESLVAHVRTVEGLAAELEIDVPTRLAPELETAVFRIVQEGVANVARHARAECVRVSVSAGGDAVTATVTDDGQGFVTGASHRGFGLAGIAERVSLAGGRLELRSRPGETVLSARLPFSDERS